jgi:hypothetical protein
VYKKRIPLAGQGKRASTRTIIVFKLSGKAFFIYGFEKNKRSNITSKELVSLKKVAKVLLNISDIRIRHAINKKELFEVKSETIN